MPKGNIMSKTIKQIADEIGVSKQAVQKRISREPLCTRIQPYIDKKGNTKYISVVGEKLIKSAFEGNEDIDASIDNNNDYDNQCTQLYIENLIKQLDIKDKQIDKLQEENNKLINSIENMTQSLKGEQALHAGTMQKELLEENKKSDPEEPIEKNIIIEKEEIKEKKGFFKRIFGKE